MVDREKVIKGLERCLICNTSVIASAEGKKAYRDCEYTIGLYCGKDKLLRDALALLKEQEAVVRCKDCKHRPELKLYSDRKGNYTAVEFPDGSKCPCQCEDFFYSWYPKDDWFCADGEQKEVK